MSSAFTIAFSNGTSADVVHAHPSVPLASSLQQLGLTGGQPTLVIIGGASRLSDEDFNRLRLLFVEVLAPLVQKWNAYVVDGGTDAGVMRLMGEARATLDASFPLVGVAPIGLATLPGEELPSSDAAYLEPNHTHFLLIPGSNWGDESAWIAHTASELASGQPTVAVLTNGGEISWHDASANVQAGRLLIVIAGSGRTADVLASVLRGENSDQRAQEIIDSGLVQAIDLTTGREELTRTIESIFAGANNNGIRERS